MIIALIFVALCAIGFFGYRKLEQSKQAWLRPRKNEIDTANRDVCFWENKVCGTILEVLTDINGFRNGRTYYDVSKNLTGNYIESIQRKISQMKETNNSIINKYPNENMNAIISDAETKLAQAEEAIAEFEAFVTRMSELAPSKMMNESSYGNINSAYWNQVRGMARADAVRYVACCDEYITNRQVEEIYRIDIEKLLRCVWYFATEKPFSASDFQKATSVFNRVYKQSHADIIIAKLYAKYQMGGEDTVSADVNSILREWSNSYSLVTVASSLMWMKAYQLESTVLKYMLSSGAEMTAKAQERLRILTCGGGKAPSGFDVKPSFNAVYFDVSALAWRDDEYVGLFDNLAFKDKILTYSLAVREENKELFIPQGINLPGTNGIVNKINSVFSEEYGNSVTVRSANCIALSGSGEERMEGILVSPGDCKQMGILMYMARIGKKLTIRFYTLFMPIDSDLAMQKQQALSLYKKLSPSVAMWESSLKDMMLMSVEQILNSSVQINDAPTATATGGISNEPIF